MAEVERQTGVRVVSLAERAALTERRREIQERLRVELVPLHEAHEAARDLAAAVRARTERECAEANEAERAAMWAAMWAVYGVRARSERETHQIERELTSTAPPAIVDFIDRADGERRAIGRTIEEREWPETVQTNQGPAQRRVVETNARSAKARAHALRDAIAVAKSMKLAALSEAEVAERLTTLRDGIPPIAAPETIRGTLLRAW